MRTGEEWPMKMEDREGEVRKWGRHNDERGKRGGGNKEMMKK